MVDLRNFCFLAYASGFTLWSYRTLGFKNQTLHIGYFTDVAGQIKVGDKIEVSAQDGGISLFVAYVTNDLVLTAPWG